MLGHARKIALTSARNVRAILIQHKSLSSEFGASRRTCHEQTAARPRRYSLGQQRTDLLDIGQAPNRGDQGLHLGLRGRLCVNAQLQRLGLDLLA